MGTSFGEFLGLNAVHPLPGWAHLHTGMTHTHSGFRAASGENPCDPFLPGWRIVRMRVLLTGANGYIGLRLLPELLATGHHVFAVVRDRRRFPVVEFEKIPGRLSGDRIRLVGSFPLVSGKHRCGLLSVALGKSAEDLVLTADVSLKGRLFGR